MYIAHRWSDRNLTLAERIISWTVIVIFVVFLLTYSLRAITIAEKSAVIITINNINSALKFQANYAALKKDWNQLNNIMNINPLTLTSSQVNVFPSDDNKDIYDEILENDKLQSNYLGEFDYPVPELMVKGVWYYDKNKKELVYLIKNTEFFNSELNDPERISFTKKIDYIDVNDNGTFEADKDKFKSINIETKHQYQWNF
jgi:hypothetical protein